MARSLDWLKEQDTHHSITALEILKGVLSNPEMQELAHFYYRDHSFVSEVPEVKRAEISAENDEARAKQENLKEDIRKLYTDTPENICEYHPEYAGLKVNWKLAMSKLSRGNNEALLKKLKVVAEDDIIDPDEWQELSTEERELILPFTVVYLNEESLKEFGESVFQDLQKSINDTFEDKPEWEDPILAERQAHDDYLKEKTRLFVGRQKEINESLSHLKDQSSESSKPLYIWGPGGIGKSALTAKIVDEWSSLNPDIPFFTYFLGTTGSTMDLLSFLHFLYKELTTRLELESEEFPEKESEIVEFMSNFLGSIESPCFLMIDAIDQLNDSGKAGRFDWLPEQFGEGIHCLISSLPVEAIEKAQELDFQMLEVSSLDLVNRKALVSNYLSIYRKKLGYDRQAGIDQMELLLSKGDCRASSVPGCDS